MLVIIFWNSAPFLYSIVSPQSRTGYLIKYKNCCIRVARQLQTYDPFKLGYTGKISNLGGD